MKKYCSLIIFFLLSTVFLYPDDIKSPLDFYDSEFVKINYAMFGGITLNYQGSNYSITFGLDSRLKDLLSKDTDVKKLIDSYSNLNFCGNFFMWGGAIAILCIPLVMVATMNYSDYSYSSSWGSSMTLYLSLETGGLIAMLIGTFLLPSSYEALFNGVNLYNRNKMKSYQN